MVRTIVQQECTVVELGPTYDSLDSEALDEVGSVLLTQASAAEPPRLVVDFSQTSLIGSTFLELLVRAWKRLSERGGAMALCGLQPFCAEVFRVTRLETLWHCCPTRDEAVTALLSG
jgi:stage II sporulation protein AA (anti-sigma F factor antagonist)